ncbi:family 43 glycosylhydrolase [Oxalobacteraceae bacterium A2-2]
MMKSLATLLCALSLSLSAAADPSASARFERYSYTGHSQEQVRPGPGEFLNPVLSGYFPDPSLTRVGEDYYLVNSSFTNFPGLPIMHSRDLVTWTQVGNALDRPDQVDFSGVRGSQGIYAPDISYHDGRYYIVTTCSSCPGGIGNFVITATNPAGPWSKPVTIQGLNGIDPSLFWDGGRLYVVHNDAPEGKPRYDGHRAIWIVELDPATLQRIGQRKVLVDGGTFPDQKPIWIEGPHLFKKDGYYYLICAEGGTGDNHSEVVFRSREVMGPYVPGPVHPILTQRDLDPRRPHPVTTAGHAKFVQTQNGDWWAVFLATRPYPGNFYNIGRETFLLPVSWKDGWPLILEQGRVLPYSLPKPALPAQAPAAPPMNGDFSYVDEFDRPLSPAWIGLRVPRAPLYRLEQGALVLNSGQRLGELSGVPGFIGRRQQHHEATVATTVEYAPQRDGDRAGLLALQNDDAHLFLGLAQLEGRRVVALLKTENGQETLLASAPYDGSRAELVLDMHGGRARASYRSGGQAVLLKDDVDVTFLSTQKAKGFVGVVIGPYVQAALATQTWMADNGNGTYTNPIFHDEFSDPDIIRVGDWFYLTGTTMHAMPGLPVLRSRDLVNWEFLAYAEPRLDYGPQYRLEQGKSIHGQGIWAPSLRYRDGVFYIFSNVNGRATQVYSATDPRGPWTRREMKRGLHDLSVLFEDDGKAYVVWGHQDLQLARLNDDLTDIVPGTERTLFSKTAGMGEGAHFYKINGKYYILSANYAGGFRMPAARADSLYGPYEVNLAISKDESFGLRQGYSLRDKKAPASIQPPDPARAAAPLHQGGIVLTPAGEWWGFSMSDNNSVGRLLNLSPVTWQDGWPYFGLPGNLTRTPRTWVKPATATPQAPQAPFERSDDFASATLKPIWQWNHAPVDGQWSLTQRPGYLRLHALPATSFWDARNTLTQRAIGPLSTPTVLLDTAGMRPGDVAGLGLLNTPYGTLAVEKSADGLALVAYDQASGASARASVAAARLWLRADCNFLTEKARFSYSVNGKDFVRIGEEFTMVFQLNTFQGVRYALFNYHQGAGQGGYADIDSVEIRQPYPRGLMRPIPYGQAIRLRGAGQLAALTVRDLGLGRVALQGAAGYLSVAPDGAVALAAGQPGVAQSFQWMETPSGELLLMSLATNRYLRVHPDSGKLTADSPGPVGGSGDGVRLQWYGS